MSAGTANNLSEEMMHRLRAAVGSRPTEDTTQIEATEYNWNQPHYFDHNQLNKLEDFTENLARAVAEKFADFCHSEFEVKVVSTTQHFVAELLAKAETITGIEYQREEKIWRKHLKP